jgi:hypothetical protein
MTRRNGLIELVYIEVEFQRGGKEYVYQSPFFHKKGDLVLVNVYGDLKVATVLRCSTDTDYVGTVKTIVGIASLLEDLDQPVPQITSKRKNHKSLMNRFQDYLNDAIDPNA